MNAVEKANRRNQYNAYLLEVEHLEHRARTHPNELERHICAVYALAARYTLEDIAKEYGYE